MPDVVWECEYSPELAHKRDYVAITANREFQGVERHMETLLRRFDAGTYAAWNAERGALKQAVHHAGIVGAWRSRSYSSFSHGVKRSGSGAT